MIKKIKFPKQQSDNLVKAIPEQKHATKHSIDNLSVHESSIQQTRDDPNTTNLNSFIHSYSQIEIDTNKQAVATQNIPIAIPVPQISKFYICINLILCLLYLLTGLFCSQTFFTFTSMELSSVPVILIICLTFLAYAVYILFTIKYSHIKMFASKLQGSKSFQTYYSQIKSAKTWFQAELLADKISWRQKDQTKQFIYEPKVIDKSGKFYPLPDFISYIKSRSDQSNNPLGQTKNIENNNINLRQQSLQNLPNIPKEQFKNDHQEQPFLTIVIAEYEKKYYFVSQRAKMSYLNCVQHFMTQNEEMFEGNRAIKGYRNIQFMVDEFEDKKTFLMLKSLSMKNGQRRVDRSSREFSKLSNDSILDASDSNSLRILQESEVKHKPTPLGLMYKNEIKNDSHKSVQKGLHLNSTNEYGQHNNESFFVILFWVVYWVSLISGLGAFYEYLVLKKFVKCIRVTITKEIHELPTIDQLQQKQ